MRINRYWSWETPKILSDVCVVIDVYAATTNIPIILSQKPQNLLIVNEGNLLRARRKFSGCLVTGESNKLPPSVFDAKNLPYEIKKLNLVNKNVLYMSNNGSRVIENLVKCFVPTIITASFANIITVSDWIKNNNFSSIDLIAAGDLGIKGQKSLEDDYCSKALGTLISNQGEIKDDVLKSIDFITRAYSPPPQAKEIRENFPLVFTLDAFPIVPKCALEPHGFLAVSPVYSK